MADTERTLSDLLTNLFQDGQGAGAITPQDMRDFIVSSISGPAMGELDYADPVTGTTVTISGISDGLITNLVKVAPVTTLDNHRQTDNGGANNGRLRYTGAITKMFHVAVSISLSPATNNDAFVLAIAKNGIPNNHCRAYQKLGATTDLQSTAMHCMVSLSTNDYIELFVGNMSGARNLQVKALNIFAMGMQ